jgi:hypothetical protein
LVSVGWCQVRRSAERAELRTKAAFKKLQNFGWEVIAINRPYLFISAQFRIFPQSSVQFRMYPQSSV